MTRIYRLMLVLIASIGIGHNASAQCDPILRNDSTQWIFNGAVLSSAKVGNTLYVGGNFTTMSRYSGSLVNIDASTANPLALGSWPKVNGTVNAVISDGSGGYIIGGNFTQVGTTSRSMIAQINSAGQVTAWNPNSSGIVLTLTRFGTTVYVGGSFANIGGQPRNNIAALSLATGLATSWNPNSTGAVNTLTTNVTGTVVYAGGNFANIGGQSRSNIAALDATTGLATSWNPNSTGIVNAILINGTTAYVGGSFNNIGGQPRNNAAAISTTTGLASSWNPAPNGVVNDFLLNGANILVGGTFSTIGSQSRNGVGEVDPGLGNATSLNYALPAGAQVYEIKLTGNDLYLGGTFTLTSGQANLIKINKALGLITPWECNLSAGPVRAIEATATRVVAGGSFTNYYKNRQRIAAIDFLTDTLIAWSATVNGSVNAIAANATTVYIGGGFTNVGGTTRNFLGALDASTAALSTWNPAPTSTVMALKLNGNTLYVGGAFTSIAANSRGRAASFDITTNTLSTWNPQFSSTVNTILIGSTEVYFGGLFTLSASTTRNRLASFNLSTGLLSGWNPNADGTVNSLAANGSRIYAAGSFNNIGSQFSPRLAEIDATTGVATSWAPYPNGTVNSIAFEAGKIFAGGAYTNNGGVPRLNLSSVETTTSMATTWDPSASNTVNYIGIHSGRMIVGGSFATIAGASYPFGAQFNLKETTPVVTITGKSQVCAFTSTTFTAYTDVIGASYQWKRNNINIGTNSPTLSLTPNNNDQIQVVITAPAGSCYSPSTATSNTITVTQVAPVTPTASVSGNTTVCGATSTTYTANTNVSNATYVWRINGNPTGTSGSTFTYVPANGDQINVQVFPPTTNGCFTSSSVTSPTQTITVNVPVAPTISISTPNTTICAGASVTFTATTNVTGGTYQWKVNGSAAGTNSNTFMTTTLTNGSVVTADITIPVGGCFTASGATSSGITMTVNPNVTPTVTISGNTSPCSGSFTTYTATTNVPGASYQWKRNNVNIGGNTSAITLIPATGDVITVVVTTPAGSCYTTPTVTSNVLTITPMSLTTPTASISGSTNVCQGTTVTYTATTNVANAAYQWKVNNINVGTNSSTFSFTPSNGNTVQCVVTTPAGQGCYTGTTANSNILTITVNAPLVPTATIATNPAGNTSVCSNTPVTFQVTATNVTSPTYQWRVNGFNIGGATSSTLTYTPSNGNVITCVVTAPAGACFSPASGTSNGITMTIIPSTVPTIFVTESANNVCAGTNITYTAATNITGGSYQWKVNAINAGTNSNTFSYTPVQGDVVTCTITVPGTGCFTSPTATSNGIFMVIQTPVIPSVSVTPSATTICQGATVNYTATTNVPGAFYTWKVNSNTVGTNSPTFSYQPVDDDIVLCIVTTPVGCYTTNVAGSTIIVMSVTPPTPHSFNVVAPGIAEVGSTVTVSANVQSAITSYSIQWYNKGVLFATTTTNTTTYAKTQGIDTITAVITPTDACYAVTTSAQWFVYSVATGVNDINKTVVSVYPNPFSDKLTVKGIGHGDKIVLYDMTGKKLMEWEIGEDRKEQLLDIRDLPAGSYMLRVTDENNQAIVNQALQKLQ